MPFALPKSPDDLRDATWETLAPYYEQLATEAIAPGGEQAWLVRWSEFQSMVEEAATLAMIAYTCDTTDPAKEAANLRWSSEIYPLMLEQHVRLAKRLVDLGYVPPGMALVVREFRTDIEIFRDENVPLISEIEELTARYQKVTGGLTVDWDGVTKTVPQLQPYLKSTDRAVRERAFREVARAYQGERDALIEIFDRLYALRQQVARNAGFSDYLQFAFRQKYRFDYTPDDCVRFHDAVEAAVTPAVERLHAHRRAALGVETLRPWDTLVQLEANAPIVPFHNADGLITPARRIFAALDPELGADFASMADAGLLDVESRPGKAPGGYCCRLSWRGQPFIFMNAVGVPDDINTLVHEAGHCFHDFATHPLPLLWQRSTGHEAAELASMGMELLAMPYLTRPVGYYSEAEARAVEIEQLEDILTSLAHIASVDAFQRWIYTHPDGGDAAARDQAWLAMRRRFERGVDWRGFEMERVTRWYRQLHIFELPFYYIEYGIAQLGALQLWSASRRDPTGTVARYKSFLRLGGTCSLPDLYAAAGARLTFDIEDLRLLVTDVEERIRTLRSAAAAVA